MKIPSQKAVPGAYEIPTYPLVEHGLWLFIWMGDRSKADASTLPDLAEIGDEHVTDLSDVRARGLLMASQEALNADVTRFDAQGFTVKFHAAGDAAVRAALNAIEAARKANGFSGQLHDVAHNSFVQMDDIRRARGIAATFEFSP